MNVADVKRAYFNALDNPSSGVFVQFADVICEAIVAEFGEPEVKAYAPVKETRVEVISETR
jgi:hypothetical protein